MDRVPLAPLAGGFCRACLVVLIWLFLPLFSGLTHAEDPTPASSSPTSDAVPATPASEDLLPTPAEVMQEPIPAPREEVPAPPELAVPGPPLVGLALESGQANRDTSKSKWFWDETLCFVWVPDSLLWEVPWANQREPRMYAKFNNALRNGTTIDTGIGAQWGIVRLAPDKPHEGFQFDMFAAVFTRFDDGALMAADYRVGTPLTYAKDGWEAKVAYEHTSGHYGDKFIDHNPDFPRRSFTRDEIVSALAYRFWDQLRVYGQIGYAFGKRRPPGGDQRYDVGLEWSYPIFASCPVQPFVAVDLDLRPEQNYVINRTIQVGTRWADPRTRRAIRLALEYYDGRNPFGGFVRRNEDWVGASLLLDW